MNTTTNPITNSITNSTANSFQITARLASVALAAGLTLAMLAGVDTLATTNASAPQMAQAASASHT